MVFNPDLSLIQPFSAAAARPGPYAALFKKNETQLYFLAAKHGDPDTLKAVRQAFEEFKPQVVIVEGVSKETSPAEYLEHCLKQSLNNFRQGGEGSLATVLAGENGINFIPGEPTAREIHQNILAQGKTTEDLLGLHAVQMVQQKNRGGNVIKTEDIPKIIQESLDDYTKRLGLEKPFGFQEFCVWYQQRMGKKFDPETVLRVDMSTSDGSKANFIQRMMYATDKARDPHILDTIAEQLSKHKRVLVVYGSGHFVKQERVLTEMLGKPKVQARSGAKPESEKASAPRQPQPQLT